MKRFYLVLTLLLCFAFAGASLASASEAGADYEDAPAAHGNDSEGEDVTNHIPMRAPEGVASPFVNLQYKLMYWQGEWVVTIRGIIDEELLLPATVEVGVPAGSEVFWVGEVYAGFGNQPLGSGEISPPYYVYTEGDTDIYTVVLTTTHAVQIEFPFIGDPRVDTDEDDAVQFSYTPLGDVEELWLATAIPANSAVLDAEVRELDGLGPQGELSFARTFYDAVGGQEYTALIEYRTGVTEVQTNLHPAVPIGIVVGMLLLAGGAFLFYKKNEYQKADSKR